MKHRRGLTRGGAALLFFVLASAAGGMEGEDDELFELPPLPEGFTAVVRPGSVDRPERVDRLRDVVVAVRSCWQPPKDGGYSGQELTLRLSFKRSGELLGQPRITYYKAGGRSDEREDFARSVRTAFERCTPLPFTTRFGAAVAGRPFSFRFVDARPL